MSNKIQVLAPTIAERIAAGEVIERPSSVVKELIENSLDAGATEIAVSLEGGGKDLIEVIDNGSGMSPRDLELCIERHATSKLRSLEDLEKILTLGFRGEALASISAVSDVTLTSRQEGEDTTFEVEVGDLALRGSSQLKAKKITFGRFLNSVHGTRIRATGLFSQVPARLKFLKSQAAEVSQVRECIEKLALAHPQVGFRLSSEDRIVCQYHPQDEASRIRAVLADGEDFPLLTLTNEQDGFRDVGLQIRVHWLQGLSSPQSRKLIQIVNSRVIRDRMLQQALLSPFRQALLPGQYPAVVLWMKVNPAAIDVNVHPTKTEVRFLDSRKIFQSIDSLIRNMILQKGAPAIAAPSLNSRTQSDYRTPPFETSRGPEASLSTDSSRSFRPWQISENEEIEIFRRNTLSDPPPIPDQPAHPLKMARQVGVIFNTYLVYEKDAELILVDQHAAHERIRYEGLRKRVLDSGALPHSQALLIPEVVKFPMDDRQAMEARLPWLVKLGFEVEIFGDDSLVFRSFPAEWGGHQLKTRLKNMVDRVLDTELLSHEGILPKEILPKEILMDEILFEKLASEACHSSVRAGDSLEVPEVQSLVEQLFHCDHPWNCPHGRPTVVKVPAGKFEEWFQRKV